MFTKIICATLATLAIGTAARAEPPGTLAPKGIIINRTPSGGVASVRTFGGYAPGASTTPSPTLSQGGPGPSQSGFGGNNFFLGNSVQGHQPTNVGQATQARQATQPRCNGKGLCWSDARLKRNVELITHLDNGLGLYRFSYDGSDRLYVGVMAQEVARLVPEAVVRGDGGFLQVNYRRLGLRMQTWDEWSASR